ncbi:MAG TPA: sterol desaturase family protein [Gemmatimonadales bacterium]|nr:sterol desaturase family protein [Gemmatimonadales bacterium]
MDIIEASIPLFFALIGVELLSAKRRRHQVYRLNDSVADLSCGILSQLTGILLALMTYGIFAWIGARWSIQHWTSLPAWPDGPPLASGANLAGWIVVFLLVDLCYYWSHRLSHEVNLLWAGHVVHHSSEEYNLTVALRQSSLHGLFTWVFYAPLALLGVPWLMFAVCHGLNLIYQFWIHTREIQRLGPLEWFMNTPSHHRVHHGVNPKYQDRNYAGVLIIWDRLFGSFTPEEEEPVYGITRPLGSWNPLWANVHVFVEIFRAAWQTRRWRDKLKVIFGPPSWRPADLGGPVTIPEVRRATFRKFDPEIPAAIRRYTFVQFVVALLAAVALLRYARELTPLQIGVVAFYITLTLSNLGSLLEGARWVGAMEVARLATLVVTAGVLLAFPRFDSALVAAAGLFGIASITWYWRLSRARPLLAAGPGQMTPST